MVVMRNGSMNLKRLTPLAFIAVISLRFAALPAVNKAAKKNSNRSYELNDFRNKDKIVI